MTAKHTPGPWFVNGPWNIQADTHTEIPVLVAHIVPLRNENIQERKANAQLMAAAPEMLEALDSVFRMLLCREPKTLKGYSQRCSFIDRTVRNVLNKAEGSSL